MQVFSPTSSRYLLRSWTWLTPWHSTLTVCMATWRPTTLLLMASWEYCRRMKLIWQLNWQAPSKETWHVISQWDCLIRYQGICSQINVTAIVKKSRELSLPLSLSSSLSLPLSLSASLFISLLSLPHSSLSLSPLSFSLLSFSLLSVASLSLLFTPLSLPCSLHFSPSFPLFF
jgi:hypothetical protein